MLSIDEMPGINKLPTPSSQTSLLNSEKMAGYCLAPLISGLEKPMHSFSPLQFHPVIKSSSITFSTELVPRAFS